jgi:sodium-independent sulfate anion transporter 11
MGVSAMMMLYIIRSACTYISRKRPQQARFWFFVSTLRTVFVILLYTMISWRALPPLF